MAKLTQQEIAQRFALQGDIESAAAELSSLQRRGDIGASASLAEIAAYKGEWKEVLQRVEVVFAAPSSLDTLNVYQDMVLLVARAGMELKKWPEIRRLAKFALTKLTKKQEHEAHVEAVLELSNFAGRDGEGSYVSQDESEERRKARFEAGLDKLAKNTKKRFKKPADRLDHLFGLASVYGYYPGAVAIYDQEKDLPTLFDNVAFAASGLARCGRTDEAWRAIRSRVHLWWPVEVTQIAPVVLLTDDAIKPLMTPQRCKEVLGTPRGPEAKAK